jgi:GNAT superfamily N-acetyltransferase
MMSSATTVVCDLAPDAEAILAVRDGLIAYNRTKAEDDHFQPVTIVLRDPEGHVVGGLLGATYWGWLVVEILWVAEGFRGQGRGRTLLDMAEQEALRRGCRHAHLDTMIFQARAFYEHAGYTIFGTLRDLPLGHSRYFMSKTLDRGSE